MTNDRDVVDRARYLMPWNVRDALARLHAEAERQADQLADAQVLAHEWMQQHDELLGFVQSHPEMLTVLIKERGAVRLTAPAPAEGKKCKTCEGTEVVTDSDICDYACPDCKPDEGRASGEQYDSLIPYLTRQWEWSKRTFGPGRRTLGILAHIRKELAEIEAKPEDLSEWADVAILAMDGFWRHGGRPEDLMRVLQTKQEKNFARTWPKPTSEDEAVEHDRSGEQKPTDNASGGSGEAMYYIQNRGYCGDCLLWWRANRCGYTMDLSEALKVTAEEAAKFTRVEDIPWLVSDIDAIAQRHVNSEHMQGKKRAALSEAKQDAGKER